MKPSPPADKRTLIRRVTYDLTGLPPTPGEVQAFLDDNSPDAFAKVVDRLLASPQYGERWGRYWLDIARYADTKGDIKAQPGRAAVIPMPGLIAITSCALSTRTNLTIGLSSNKWRPTNCRRARTTAKLAALGFLAVGPRFNDNKNDIYNDRIDVVCKGMLGLTVSCARCHDHKFDPIPQTDYYSLRGIFDSSVEPAEDPPLETPK